MTVIDGRKTDDKNNVTIRKEKPTILERPPRPTKGVSSNQICANGSRFEAANHGGRKGLSPRGPPSFDLKHIPYWREE